MEERRYRKTTQKEFLRVAAANPVTYEPYGVFRAGDAEVTVKQQRIGAFAEKLSHVLSFEEYDRLTRHIWVSHMRLPPKPWPYLPD
jgi:hypothetical protein